MLLNKKLLPCFDVPKIMSSMAVPDHASPVVRFDQNLQCLSTAHALALCTKELSCCVCLKITTLISGLYRVELVRPLLYTL